MSKPNKIQYNGNSKIIAALVNVGNWLLDNGAYTLPIASASRLGGIKVGSNLTITEEGVLNAQAGGGSDVSVTPIVTTGTKIAKITITEGTSDTDYNLFAPTPSTVNDATITIKKNNTTVDSFTLNQSSNKDINISVPTVTDSYDGTSSEGMSGKAVKSAIDALDVTTSGAAASKTITALSQTDGKISATFSDISITKSQVSDFPTNVSSFTNDSGYVTTDEKVTPEDANPSSDTGYLALCVPALSATTNQKPKAPSGYMLSIKNGTSSAVGHAFIRLGNDKASGSANNKCGKIRLYSQKTKYVDLVTTANMTTADRTITLPDADGTIALTSNIPTKTSDLTNDSGFIPRGEKYTSDYNMVWTQLAGYYSGGTTPTYVRIKLPDSIATVWTMLNMELLFRQDYNNNRGGKMIINCQHNSTSPYTWTGNATIYGYFSSTAIEVYASDGKYIYIKGIGNYTTVALTKIIVGDYARTKDFSTTAIDNVSSLPSTYQTFIVKKLARTDELTTYAFAEGTNNGEIKITPSVGGTAGTAVTVKPKGISDLAYIAKGSGSSKFLREDGTWQTVTATWNGGSVSNAVTINNSLDVTGTSNMAFIEPYSVPSSVVTYVGTNTNPYKKAFIREIYLGTTSTTNGHINFSQNLSSYTANLYAPSTALSGNINIHLPSVAGTLALTSDISDETARRSRYTMSTKGAWTTASYSSNLPSSYGHAIILVYYTINNIRCIMNEIRVTKAEWENCASPNIMMPFVSSPPNDAYGVYLQYVSTSQFKYYVGSGLQGEWSVTIKTTVV